MGPHCGLVSEKILGLKVTLKVIDLKTPGQTNSGALYLLQEPSPGRFVAAPRGPMVAYFDKMSCNRCNEAPLCGFLPSVDSCRLLSGAIRRWALVASFQRIARFPIGSIALPLDWVVPAHSFRLLPSLARADDARASALFNAGLIVQGVLVVFFLVAFFLGRNKNPSSRWKTATGGKPIGRALAVLDASSLSRNRSGHSVGARRGAWGTGSP